MSKLPPILSFSPLVLESLSNMPSFRILDGQDTLQNRQESRKESSQEGRTSQEEQEARRDLLFLHLQGLEASPPRYRYLQEGYVYHELLHQRYL